MERKITKTTKWKCANCGKEQADLMRSCNCTTDCLYRKIDDDTEYAVKEDSTPTHAHRKPKKKDFQGKCIQRFVKTADNIWKFWFTDGTAFAIQAETTDGIAYMEICDVCYKN